jgi:hypothetical protein
VSPPRSPARNFIGDCVRNAVAEAIETAYAAPRHSQIRAFRISQWETARVVDTEVQAP